MPLVLAAVPAYASETQLIDAIQLRTGPSDSYPAVKRLAKGLDVQVHGCLQTWDWCDVEWRGARGWVPAHAVEFQREDRHLPLNRYGKTLAVPVIGFSLAKYWDAHYKTEPWYGERDRWMQRSARLESGGLMIENAVESTRLQVATIPVSAPPAAEPVDVNPPLSAPLSAPVNELPINQSAQVPVNPPVTTTETTTILSTTVAPPR
jgi:uncharacterized protein YraI